MNLINLEDWAYARSVLNGTSSSEIPDGQLPTLEGSRSRTRRGYAAWLLRVKKSLKRGERIK
jgi:hypothetical protein